MPPQKQQPQTKALTPVDEFKRSIAVNEPGIKAVLPSHISIDKFKRVLATAVTLKPEIATTDRRLLWGEILKCAQDGLTPDGDEATINAFGSKPKYMPMVKGICKKARNSGMLKTIDAVVVYENDTYESWIDEKGPHFKFIRAKGDRGTVRLTFSYAITNDEGFFHEEINEKQMAAIEAISRASTGPWKGPFKDEMRRKSAIRRLAKYRLPSSADIENVIKRDDDLYDPPGKDNEPKKEPPKDEPSRLKNIIETEDLGENTSTTAEQAPEQAPPATEKPKEEPPI